MIGRKAGSHECDPYTLLAFAEGGPPFDTRLHRYSG